MVTRASLALRCFFFQIACNNERAFITDQGLSVTVAETSKKQWEIVSDKPFNIKYIDLLRKYFMLVTLKHAFFSFCSKNNR